LLEDGQGLESEFLQHPRHSGRPFLYENMPKWIESGPAYRQKKEDVQTRPCESTATLENWTLMLPHLTEYMHPQNRLIELDTVKSSIKDTPNIKSNLPRKQTPKSSPSHQKEERASSAVYQHADWPPAHRPTDAASKLSRTLVELPIPPTLHAQYTASQKQHEPALPSTSTKPEARRCDPHRFVQASTTISRPQRPSKHTTPQPQCL
jgi:hypothetical protein